MANRSVTLQAAAERLGISADALREWCRNHDAPSTATRGPNGRVLYYLVDPNEIRAWRKSRKHGNLKRHRDVGGDA